MTQMLFNPSVQAAFMVAREITPMTEIKANPDNYANKHLAIAGKVTEVTDDQIVIEDYVTVKLHGWPWSEGLQVGDRIELDGKLVFPLFSKRGSELRYAEPFRPLPNPAS